MLADLYFPSTTTGTSFVDRPIAKEDLGDDEDADTEEDD
jgi:hypothetical protein